MFDDRVLSWALGPKSKPLWAEANFWVKLVDIGEGVALAPKLKSSLRIAIGVADG